MKDSQKHVIMQQKMAENFTVLSNNFSSAEMIEPVWPGCGSK